MDYEVVLPPDTQHEIDDFIEQSYVSRASALAAADALDAETSKLAANPTLGAAPLGTPLESRRVHRFRLVVDDSVRTVEFLYCIRKATQRIILTGFRLVPPKPL